MSGKVFITPQVLKWARTTANISLEKAASTTGSSVDRVMSWEDGTDQPTIKQAEKLALLYRRPLAVFFLPRIPRDFTTLRDFRSTNRGELSTALIFMMRDVQEKQDWARTVLEESGEDTLSFVGKFNRNASVETVANDIRTRLGIVTSEMNGKALKYWVQKTEQARIFVSLSSNVHSHLKIDSEQVKGFAIADPYAPFVFLNSDDWDNPQLFTLVHELAHIWIDQSGISVDTQIAFREKVTLQVDPVEIFCNRVAANALLPKDELIASFQSVAVDFNRIEIVSKRFGVSTLTMMYRLFDLNIITEKQLFAWKREAERLFQVYMLKHQATLETNSGAPSYYVLQIRKNGKAFSQMVFDYYRGGHISGIEASHLLNVKLNNFSKYEKQLYS